MNINIKQILRQGEGISVEFKKSTQKLPESLFETICAFLNRNGGVILLGVDDNKDIIGIDTETAPTLCKNIASLSNNPKKLFPAFLLDVQLVEYNKKTLIHIFVPASSQVHTCNGKIYDRSVDGDFELKSSEQIKNLYTRKSTLYSENTIYPYLYEKDFKPGIVERVRKIIRINRSDHPWNELTDMNFFKITGLYRHDIASNTKGFTMAALLLFGKDEVIGSAIPHYKIDALLRRVDNDRYDDRVNIRCNGEKKLYEGINNNFKIVKSKEGEYNTEKTVEKTVEKILAAIKNNPQITQVELAKITGLTRRGVEYNLSRLKEKDLIVREGPDKGGHWKVLKYE